MARAKTIVTIATITVGVAVAGLVYWQSGGGSPHQKVAPVARDAQTRQRVASNRERPQLPVPKKGPGEEVLAGRIEDDARRPVVDVAIVAELEPSSRLGPRDAGVSAQSEIVAVSAADGAFKLEGLVPGSYRLRISGPGIFDSELRFVQVPGADVTVVSQRRVDIKGRVRAGEVGVPGAEVAVEADSGDIVRSLLSDAEGAFVASGLPAGVYRVTAYSEGQAAPTIIVDRSVPGPHRPVELLLAHADVVEGRVESDAGVAVVAEVVLTSASGEVARIGASGTDGAFRIEHVLPGRWTARARADGYVAGEEVDFIVGDGYKPLLRLGRGGVITGRIVDADNAAISGAVIGVSGLDALGRRLVTGSASVGSEASKDPRFVASNELGILLGPIPLPPFGESGAVLVATPLDDLPTKVVDSPAPTVTDEAGHFEVTGLAPGRYAVAARHPDYAEGRSREVDVAVGARIEVVIRLDRGTFLAGTVRTAGGSPIAGALMTALDPVTREARWRGVTGPDGRYRLGPVAGVVVVRASAIGFGETESRVSVGRSRRDVDERTVDLVLAEANETVSGRVRDSSGFAVAGARIELAANAARVAVTDEHGRFAMAGLAAGTHRVRVHSAGFPILAATVETDRAAELQLQPGGGLALRVADRHTRQPVASALVTVKGPEAPSAQATNADGEAVFEALLSGTYGVVVDHPDYVVWKASVDVPAGTKPGQISVPDYRVELSRGARVAGTIRDQNGVRVGGAKVSVGSTTAVSDVYGHFSLERVDVGDVEVTATLDGASGELSLSLSPGQEVLTVELTIE